VGRLRFTDWTAADMLLEVEVQTVDAENLACSPAQMYRLLDFYFEAVILSLIAKGSFLLIASQRPAVSLIFS
jgi:hypothetical protein